MTGAGHGAPIEICLRAPAKVNLRLVVLAREESGYHQLETVFCALRFADLVVVRARRVTAASGASAEKASAEMAGHRQDVSAETRAGSRQDVSSEGPSSLQEEASPESPVVSEENISAGARSSRGLGADADASGILGGIRLHVSGLEPGLPEANLVHRAATAFFREAGLPPEAEIRLVKRIPAGAGLGGGSSDAAATLCALNRIHGGVLARDALLRIGGELGSDVPFFLTGASRALAWGRGERLLPLRPLPAAPALLACPSFASPTPAAYALLAEHRTVESRSHNEAVLLAPGGGSDWAEVAHAAVSDFEDVLFPRFPELRAIRDTMRAHGAVVALLAGSGSAVFAVYPDAAARRRAANRLRREFPDVRVVQTWTASG